MMRRDEGHVLLVDDDEVLLDVLGRALEHDGWHVTPARTVGAARVVGHAPRAIVTDHLLPDGSEADVAAAWPGVPLVTISGYPRPADYAGVWLAKPFPVADLVAALNLL